MIKNKNKHRGSNFRSFLKETGQLEEVETLALKKAVALQMKKILSAQELTKTDLAKRMHTSRASVDRLLNEENPSVTLATLEKGAKALGHKVKIELVPA